jgi:hypothetical protein
MHPTRATAPAKAEIEYSRILMILLEAWVLIDLLL